MHAVRAGDGVFLHVSAQIHGLFALHQLRNPGDTLLVEYAWSAGSRASGPGGLVGEPVAAALGEPAPPSCHVDSITHRCAVTCLLSVPSAQPAVSRPVASPLVASGTPHPPGQLLPLLAGRLQPGLRPSWASMIGQPVQPRLSVPRAPSPHRVGGEPQLSYRGIACRRIRARQNHPSALRQAW